MRGGRKAAARFYFHGAVEGRQADALGNHWFNVGDDVPAEVVDQVGDHLFDEAPQEESAEEPELPKRKPRVPRQRTAGDES